MSGKSNLLSENDILIAIFLIISEKQESVDSHIFVDSHNIFRSIASCTQFILRFHIGIKAWEN